ncbi:MAG: ribosome recycling factor [Candidatus Harrisonbacteria bacterium]|nr:ribosome recycling factor [Candidatus Harrisonbacteria bacterium]
MDLKPLEQKLKSAVESLRTEFQTIRSGRPSPRMVEDIKVEVYGQQMPVKALGSISVVPPREIQISVWDKSVVAAVAKAIETSSLNVPANTDGNLIRINLPSLTDERKKEFEKVVRKMTEEIRIRIRGARDEANKEIKKMEEGKNLSEDAAFKQKEEVQKLVDEINSEIEILLLNKIKEIIML